MLQWNEAVITVVEQSDTVQSTYFSYTLKTIIFANGQPLDWAAAGVTQNVSTGVLDFTAIGGFAGKLVFEWQSSADVGTGVTNQTNAYDIDATLPRLRRLGWINPTTENYNIVDADNQISLCNRWYNDNSFHPACQIEYLYDVQMDKGQTAAEFNTYLETLRDSTISKMLNLTFDQPQHFESGLLFDKLDRTRLETVSNSGRFAGLRFRLSKHDYFIHLLNAALFFDSDVSFTLYLYNEFTGLVAEWDVTAEANKQVVVDLSEAMRYNGAATKGGMWFLGYFQDDLGDAKAVRYSACWNDTKSFGADSFISDVTGDAFDMQEYELTRDTFGINIEYSVTHDLTELIRRNAYLFDHLQGLMMAATVMDIAMSSPRSNRNKRITDEIYSKIYLELNNVTSSENPTESGLKSQIRKEIKKIKASFEDKKRVTVVSLK